MIFNSFSFLVFLPVVFILYWVNGSQKPNTQNNLLLVASYFFYGWWDWRFLALLIFSTFLGYYTGHKIGETRTSGQKKIWLWVNVLISLGLLIVFKYYNFFAISFS